MRAHEGSARVRLSNRYEFVTTERARTEGSDRARRKGFQSQSSFANSSVAWTRAFSVPASIAECPASGMTTCRRAEGGVSSEAEKRKEKRETHELGLRPELGELVRRRDGADHVVAALDDNRRDVADLGDVLGPQKLAFWHEPAVHKVVALWRLTYEVQQRAASQKGELTHRCERKRLRSQERRPWRCSWDRRGVDSSPSPSETVASESVGQVKGKLRERERNAPRPDQLPRARSRLSQSDAHSRP